MPHDPRTNPRKGDKLAKVTDHRVRTRTVISVVAGVICYTPKRVLCYCSREDWRKWAKNAHVPAYCRKADVPYAKKAVAGVMQDYAGTMTKLAQSPHATRRVVSKMAKSYRKQLAKDAVTPAELDRMAAEALRRLENSGSADAAAKQALAAAQQTINGLTAELENYRSIAENIGATKAVAEKRARQAREGTNVVYSHEFAYQLLAGPNKRLVVVTPTFDMPGMSTAHAPHVQASMVEDVECLVIVPRP